jgi:hypothetical protein
MRKQANTYWDRKTGLDVFAGHPTVDCLLKLKAARNFFLKEAERIEAGGEPFSESCGADAMRNVAEDAERQLIALALRIRVDGEPIIRERF